MDDEDNEKRVCHFCIGEDFLSRQVHDSGADAKCSYCDGEEEPTISLNELADEVEGAFERHFERSSPDPSDFESALQRDSEINYEWEREGEPVLWAICGAANVSEQIAQDVLGILKERHATADSDYCGEEDDFSSDSFYEEKGSDDFNFRMEWDAIERSVKERTRFFNREATDFLLRLFANVDTLADRQGRPAVVMAGPGLEISYFFRGRVFHKEEDLVWALMRPDLNLGPPPSNLAKAGRMNAHGISVFYGASDPSAAMAEIRPPVGSRVFVGKFSLLRPVRLLEVEALQSIYVEGSYFDPAYIGHLELAKFLGRLSARMTMPVMPDDEPTEYLITQMIADFLAQMGKTKIDGMLYRSVQCDGEHKNVVLFNHASRVAEWDIPPGTHIEAQTFEMDDDGGSVNYWVSERVPVSTEPEKQGAKPFFWDLLPIAPIGSGSLDARAQTLSLDATSLRIHHIRAVTIQTDEYVVHRHRFDEKPSKFAKPSAFDDIDLDF